MVSKDRACIKLIKRVDFFSRIVTCLLQYGLIPIVVLPRERDELNAKMNLRNICLISKENSKVPYVTIDQVFKAKL